MNVKTLTIVALVLIGPIIDLVAQDQEEGAEVGDAFFKIVNLIDTGKDSLFSLNGYTFKRGNPVRSGFSSGAFKLEPGSHTLAMNNEGAENSEYEVALTVAPGSNQSVVFYTEANVAKNSDGDVIVNYKIRHTIIQGEDEIGQPKLTVFSLCSGDELRFKIKTTSYQVRPKRPINIPVALGDNIRITKMDGSLIGGVEIISPFHYVGFIDDNQLNGKLRFTFLEHRKYISISELGDGAQDNEE